MPGDSASRSATMVDPHRPLHRISVPSDSVEAAVAAYRSPAYQEALRVLDHGARREIRIVDGVD